MGYSDHVLVGSVGLGLEEDSRLWGLTHFNVESDVFGEFLEHLFQRGELLLDEIPAAVTFEAFLLVVTRVFHFLAHVCPSVLERPSYRHGSAASWIACFT